MPTPTRKLTIEVELPISRCDICRHEETAKAGGFGSFMPDGRPAYSGEDGAVYKASNWSFPSHGSVRVSDQHSNVFPEREKSEWTLCDPHTIFMRRKIAEIILEESARVS